MEIKKYLNLAIKAYQEIIEWGELKSNGMQAGQCYFGLAESFSLRNDWKQRHKDAEEAILAYEKALEIWVSEGILKEQVSDVCAGWERYIARTCKLVGSKRLESLLPLLARL